MFLFMLKYGKYTDFFTASSEKDALKKARVLSCNTDYVLQLVQIL